jgi:hypothetical protein
MTRIISRLATVCLFASCISASQAAFFAGNAYFSQGPSSQMGPIVFNNLVINNGPFSITVSGQIKVQVPPGPVSGTLVEWWVDRPLDPTYGTSSMVTTMTLNGFSTPPSNGTYGNSSGATYTYLDQYPVVSKSNFPLMLTNGAAVWPTNTVNSSTFNYTSANGIHYLRQVWQLDGVQLSGIGGQWLIDLPLTSEVVEIPEPAGILLLLCGLTFVTSRRWRGCHCWLL